MNRLSRSLIKPRTPRLLLATLGIVLLVAAAVIALGATRVGSNIEGSTLDWRVSQRGELPARDVAIAEIDAGTVSLHRQWPISRRLHADAVERLRNAGVAAIVFDIPFDEPGFEPGEDGDFIDSLAKGTDQAPVILARRPAGDEAGAELGTVWAPFTKGNAPSADRSPLDVDNVYEGVSSRIPDQSNTVRTYPLNARWDESGRVPSLALAAVKAAGGSVNDLPERLHLSYYGPRGTFESIPYSNATLGIGGVDQLRGKVVVIGLTDAPERDEHRVPFAGEMPSAEIQATAIANLLHRSWLHELPAWFAALAAVTLAVLVWALLLCTPLYVAVPLSIGAIVGYSWLSFEWFERGVVIPATVPLVAAILAFVVTACILAALAVRERLRIRGLFARYVPADVVRDLVASDEPIQLGGQMREITVLFSDIRGFTSMSEHADPLEMVEQLNEYFGRMVEVIGTNRGTLDKFLGDGLMAIFGAPADVDDHAARACDCALEMLSELEYLNRSRKDRGLPPLRIGIGIHTGLAVVGNVGSPFFRVDFTAIGDTVNTASRLEGLTKELGVPIVTSAETVAAVGARHRFEQLGTSAVAGRTGAISVYTLTASRVQDTTTLASA
jgi:adenylate cyclase